MTNNKEEIGNRPIGFGDYLERIGLGQSERRQACEDTNS